MIERVTAATDELVEAMARLLPQLSRTAELPALEHLDYVARTNALLVARVDGRIVGTLTLVLYGVPSGFDALIEDVVVDETARGRGVGEALTREALDLARDAGADTVGLTSRPERDAANRLYRRLGFEQRETNVYEIRLAE